MSPDIGAYWGKSGQIYPSPTTLPIFHPPRRQNYHAKLFCAIRLNGPSCTKKSERVKSISSWAENLEKAKNCYFSPFLAIFDLVTIFASAETGFRKNAKHGRIAVGTFYPARPMDFGF